MPELPLEELLCIAAPQQRHRAVVATLQDALLGTNVTVAILQGEPARQLHDRHRATHLIGVVTEDPLPVVGQLTASGFEQIGNSLFHGWVPIIITLVGIPSLSGDRLSRTQDGPLVWEPDTSNALQVIDLLDERTPEIGEAIARCGDAHSELQRASGKLEIIEPRKWRLHLGQEKIIEYLRQQGKL